MKNLLSLILSLLCFSVISASNASLNFGKDVIKQKTEFVKSTQIFIDAQVASCSQKIEVISYQSNYLAVNDSANFSKKIDKLFLECNNSLNLYEQHCFRISYFNKISKINKEILPYKKIITVRRSENSLNRLIRNSC